MLWFDRRLSCRRALSLMGSYLDGDLARGIAIRIEIHLRECADCRREHHVLDRVMAAVENLERRQPPPDLWKRVHSRLSPAAATTAPLRPFSWTLSWSSGMVSSRLELGRWRNPILASIAVVAAVVLAAFWPQSSQPIPPLPDPQVAAATPYLGQATEASFFEPLADRAALGTVATVASRQGALDDEHTFQSNVRIENVMAGSQGQ